MDNTKENTKEVKEVLKLDGYRFHLTYPTHLPKEEYISWLLDKKKCIAFNFIRLAHESADKTDPYEHTHVVVDFGIRHQSKRPDVFDYKGLHPNIQPKNKTAKFEAAKRYIAKEDPDNKDLDVDPPSLYQKVQECSTLQEALGKYVYEAGHASGIKLLYESGTNRALTRFNYVPDKHWQHSLISMVKDIPNHRDVIWVVDYKGNSGKTALAKWLFVNYPDQWLITKDMGTSRDSATIIQNCIANGWRAHGIIIDLPRSAEEHIRIYQYIEEIKDGLVTAQKYSGRTIVFDQPHTVIFSNWYPQVKALSEDRWKIYTIKGEKLILTHSIDNTKKYGDPDPRTSKFRLPEDTDSD